MEHPEQERLEMIIKGRVQGVAFRWHAERVARGLGVSGWVRNQPDGSVRVLAEGSREALSALLEWARRGSDRARVDDLHEVWLPATGQFVGFQIRA